MLTADPFTTIVDRHAADDPLVGDDEDPYTTVDFKWCIATALGFPDQRYSGSLPRQVICRLYIVLCRDLPTADTTIDELRCATGTQLDFPETERFAERPGRCYNREELGIIVNDLRDITYGDLDDLLTELDICPVCDSPVDTRETIGRYGEMAPTEESVCLHLGTEGITVIEHLHV